MDEMVELKPCPFCGSVGIAVVGSFVRCGCCGAVGPYGYTEVEAVERWNMRASGLRARTPVHRDAATGAIVIETEQ